MTTRELLEQAVEFDADGFLADPQMWNEALAEQLAREIGLDELTARHWAVINFARRDFFAQGQAPTLRRITVASEVPTKELYELFPKKPAKKIAYVAGLPKPSGCI